ncbi:MAG: hypothetical protein INR62_12950, partial [Rhodospirillales bacterium]|nr:hypothetical protein [Acetobacter sp.]
KVEYLFIDGKRIHFSALPPVPPQGKTPDGDIEITGHRRGDDSEAAQ